MQMEDGILFWVIVTPLVVPVAFHPGKRSQGICCCPKSYTAR